MLTRRTWLAAGVAGALLAGMSFSSRAQAQNDLLKPGDKAPDFTLKSVKGENVTLSDLTKKSVVLVNFFFNG